jgi:hypothetical protein
MSGRILQGHVWRVVLRMAAGALVAGMSARATLAQPPAASNAGGAAHAAPSGKSKGGGIRLPHLKLAPTKEPPIAPGGSNVVNRNAIGMSVERPDGGQRPAGPNIGRAAALAPPVPPAPSGDAAGLGIRVLPAPRIAAPGPRPLVLSPGMVGGTAFTRPGTALKPLGGPTKAAATSINGTNFRPKP